MGQSNGKQHSHYSLGSAGIATAQLEEILAAATAAGTQDAEIAAMTEIMAILRSEPKHFGEPLYHLRSMGMTIRCAVILPLYVEYGVHEEQPVVVIRRVLYLTAGAA